MGPPLRSRLLVAALAAFAFVLPGSAWGMDANAVFEKIKNSVVTVYQMRNDKESRGLGSGFAVGDGTLVVTNQHVVRSISAILLVRTQDGSVLRDVKVIRLSSADDLAVIKLPKALPPLELYGGKAEIGQEVAALGNPKGLLGTLSTGVVSGVRTDLFDKSELLQFTAAISPGSSGGPVVDRDGRVLGVASLLIEEGQSLNFAIPVDRVRTLLGRDLLPGAWEERRMPPLTGGNLDVRQAPDGSITIIQKRKRQ